LDLQVTAEGVEVKEQLHFLQKNQCRIIQGYYFSKPLSAAAMTDFIESNL
jgi:EAL domain-containing protein (putative c-di-GMP-specific phosphodiesterase class I)